MTYDGSREGREEKGSGANGSDSAWLGELWRRKQDAGTLHLPGVASERVHAAVGVHGEPGHLPAQPEGVPTTFWLVVQRLRRLAQAGVTAWEQF